MKKQRQQYELDYIRCIVQEYLAGVVPAQELARREGLERGQIYKWRVQLERRDRQSRIESIAETEGVSIEQARRIRELEEELAATQQKLAQTLLECDLVLYSHCLRFRVVFYFCCVRFLGYGTGCLPVFS